MLVLSGKSNSVFLKKDKIYHGVLHFKPNAFKAANDLKFLKVFYPSGLIIPFSKIKESISNYLLNLKVYDATACRENP